MISKTPHELENDLIGIICRLDETEMRKLSSLIDLAIKPDRVKELKERIRIQKDGRTISDEEWDLDIKDITFFNNKIKSMRSRQEWMDFFIREAGYYGVINLYSAVEREVNIKPFEYKQFGHLVDWIFLKWIKEEKRLRVWGAYQRGWTDYYITLGKQGSYGVCSSLEDAIGREDEVLVGSKGWEHILEGFGRYDKDGNRIACRSR